MSGCPDCLAESWGHKATLNKSIVNFEQTLGEDYLYKEPFFLRTNFWCLLNWRTDIPFL